MLKIKSLKVNLKVGHFQNRVTLWLNIKWLSVGHVVATSVFYTLYSEHKGSRSSNSVLWIFTWITDEINNKTYTAHSFPLLGATWTHRALHRGERNFARLTWSGWPHWSCWGRRAQRIRASGRSPWSGSCPVSWPCAASPLQWSGPASHGTILDKRAEGQVLRTCLQILLTPLTDWLKLKPNKSSAILETSEPPWAHRRDKPLKCI